MRTSFLAPIAILAWLLGGAAAPRPAYDVVIRGGTIYDGSGGAPYVGDVAISGDHIVAIGRVPGRGAIWMRGGCERRSSAGRGLVAGYARPIVLSGGG